MAEELVSKAIVGMRRNVLNHWKMCGENLEIVVVCPMCYHPNTVKVVSCEYATIYPLRVPPNPPSEEGTPSNDVVCGGCGRTFNFGVSCHAEEEHGNGNGASRATISSTGLGNSPAFPLNEVRVNER